MTEGIRLAINKEIATLCWKHTDEERLLLTASLKDEGCRDPIYYWEIRDTPLDKCPIVDGHTRYEICREWGINYTVRPMQFVDMLDAVCWVSRNQMGRRNASEAQKAYLRGKLHMTRKSSRESGILSEEPAAPPEPPNLAKAIAKESRVSLRTIHNDTRFAKAMDKLGKKSPNLRDAALKGSISKRHATIIADASESVLRGIENVPDTELNACVKSTVSAMQGHKPPPIPGAKPIIHLKPLADLEKVAGQLVRANTDALTACGGAGISWAKARHEAIRLQLAPIFDEILAWQRKAQEMHEE